MALPRKGRLTTTGARRAPGKDWESTHYERLPAHVKTKAQTWPDDGSRIGQQRASDATYPDEDRGTSVSAKDYRQDKRASADEVRAKAKAKARPKAKAKAKARPAMRPATTRPKAKAAAAKAKARPKAKAQVMKPRPKAKARPASSGGSYRPPSSLERRRRR
jgi:hypothetical protein